ncbi:MAG: hypothetical protein AAFV53_33895 [Myxococcota bacterium]
MSDESVDWEEPRKSSGLQWGVLALLGALCAGVIGFTVGQQGAPEPAPAPVAVEEADVAADAEAQEEQAATVEALQASQDKVVDLEQQLADRESELAEMKAQDEQDAARRAVAVQRWKEMEAEIARLQNELAKAESERDQLRVELKEKTEELNTALADLDKQIAETKRVRGRALAYKKANTTNLWFAFTNDAKVQICDKGSRSAHKRCHEAVDTFFSSRSRQRFDACVNTQQAMPVLRKAKRGQDLPTNGVALPEDNRFTKKGWYVLYCDPTLPEAVATDDIDAAPQSFARNASNETEDDEE